MSEPRTFRPACAAPMIAALLCAVVFSPGGAQQSDATERRIDSLSALLLEATSEWAGARRADSLRVVESARDTVHKRVVRAGPITIVADSSVAAIAERTARRALASVRSVYGRGSELLRGERWVLSERVETSMVDGRTRTIPAVRAGDPAKQRGMTTVATQLFRAHDKQIEAVWSQLAHQAMFVRMGAARTWLRQPLGDVSPVHMLESTFRYLALGNGYAECWAKDLLACRIALGIEAREGMRALPIGARHSLLLTALELGGEDAYSRFIAVSDGDVALRLESAARIPIDSLVALWRDRVLDARPAPASTPGRTAFAAMTWSVLLCLLSLRSSRWR